jgi:hypothetical protein
MPIPSLAHIAGQYQNKIGGIAIGMEISKTIIQKNIL